MVRILLHWGIRNATKNTWKSDVNGSELRDRKQEERREIRTSTVANSEVSSPESRRLQKLRLP